MIDVMMTMMVLISSRSDDDDDADDDEVDGVCVVGVDIIIISMTMKMIMMLMTIQLKDMFYLTIPSTHFINGYMVSEYDKEPLRYCERKPAVTTSWVTIHD